MRKIIAIGESVLDILFRDNQPVKAIVGGRIANAAATLGSMQLPVTMCSECCTDGVGDMVLGFLKSHNVDVSSIDRFTDGSTALSTIFTDESDPARRILNYGSYPADRFDVVWPRIDENDVLLFGSLYAIDTPQREHLYELVSYASQRNAVIVYLPGFQHGINFRITRVMPAILENLEISDIVVAHECDIQNIFPGETAAEAFRNHIEYYCPIYFHINSDLSLSIFTSSGCHDFAAATPPTANMLGWQAGFTAGIISEIMTRGITLSALKEITSELLQSMAATGFKFAAECAASRNNCAGADFAAKQHVAYESFASERAKNLCKN